MRSPFIKIYFHLVWSTWDRGPLITPAIAPRLHAALVCASTDRGASVIAIGGIVDHVHMLVRLPPSVVLSTFIGEIKGSTSHLMNAEIAPDLRFRWQGAYGAFSVCPGDIDRARNYVLRQREHHDDGTQWEEWERSHE